MSEHIEIINIKSGVHYWYIYDVKSKHNGVWKDHALYRNDKNEMFTRERKEFEGRFKPLN